jgi:pyridoxine/pyridoxamine 5'-phosphate oxidase
MDRVGMIEFVRARGLAVVATRGPDGEPQAALVGIAATDLGELLFDASARSRKVINLRADARVAVVIGWDDELTLQCEGVADVLGGVDREECLPSYVQQFPDGARRAQSPRIVLVRVRLVWGRLSDYRPRSFGSVELSLDH